MYPERIYRLVTARRDEAYFGCTGHQPPRFAPHAEKQSRHSHRPEAGTPAGERELDSLRPWVRSDEMGVHGWTPSRVNILTPPCRPPTWRSEPRADTLPIIPACAGRHYTLWSDSSDDHGAAVGPPRTTRPCVSVVPHPANRPNTGASPWCFTNADLTTPRKGRRPESVS